VAVGHLRIDNAVLGLMIATRGVSQRRLTEHGGKMRSKVKATTMAVISALCAVLVSAPVTGTHSVPAHPRSYWDHDNNGTPDPNNTSFRPARVLSSSDDWSSYNITVLENVITEWRVETAWHPQTYSSIAGSGCYSSLTCHGVFVDASTPCPGAGISWQPQSLGVNCRKVVLRTTVNDVQYWDIEDSDVYIWLDSPFVTWSWAAYHPGQSFVYDVWGILTHEIGHAVHLKDLYGSNCNYGTGMYTMCGEMRNGFPDSWRARYLEPDDINGASVVY
jgi:hypothetical protein